METQAPSHDETSELGEHLDRNHIEIEKQWLERVGQEIGRHDLPDTELKNSIPDYIQGLAKTLRRNGEEALESRGAEMWAEIARQHALTRVRQGFDVDEVLREFIIL